MHGRGEADHFHDHFVVGPGVLGPRIADKDRLGEERAVDLHEGRALRLEIGADELPRLPLEDLDHAAPRPQRARRRPACGVADVLDLDGHHVAAGRIERVLGRDEDVLCPPASAEVSFGRWPSSSGLAGDGRTKPNPFCVRWKTPTTRGRACSDRLRFRGASGTKLLLSLSGEGQAGEGSKAPLALRERGRG